MSQKYFYLHIPKTAGTTFNDFLRKNFDASECIFHIEIQIDKIDNKTVLSGHIPLPKAQKIIPNFDDHVKLTVFREPLKQVSSHLRFVRKLAEPSEKKRLLEHTPQIQKIVARLANTDLSSPQSLQEFIYWLKEENLALFHNTQTQYLVGTRFEMNAEIIQDAKDRLEIITYIGITERLDDYIFLLSHKLGFSKLQFKNKKLNVTEESFGLDTGNSEIEKVLEPLIYVDKIIYKEAKIKFEKEFAQLPSLKANAIYSFFDRIRTRYKW